jgi:hypothetical protein
MTVNWERDLPDMSLPDEGDQAGGSVFDSLLSDAAEFDGRAEVEKVLLVVWRPGEGRELVDRWVRGFTYTQLLGLLRHLTVELERATERDDEEL